MGKTVSADQAKAAKIEKVVREFPGQHPGETVLSVFRQHPVVLRKQLFLGMFALIIAILPMDVIFSGPIYPYLVKFFAITAVAVVIYWFYYWIGWYYSVYIVTDQRLIDIRQHGLFNRKVKEVGFDKIQSINYHIKGLQAAILKFGDITVETYASEWVMKSVHHPEEAHEQMMAAARMVDSTPPQK